MAAQYNFLKPIDQKVRDQGYDFVSRDEFLQDGFKPTSDISYEGDGSPVSYANSMGGIMTQAPIPRPLKYIPEGDGGGGKPPGPTGPDPGAVTADDYGYGAIGNDLSMNMTEEEQAGVDSINNAKISKMDALKAAGAFAFMGPFAGIFSAYRSQKKAREEAVATAKAAQQQRDRDAEVKSIQKRLDSGMSLGDIGRESYTGPGMAFEERDTGTGRGPKKDGGRAGYFFGGRVKYKAGGRTGYKDGYSVQDDMGDYAENVGKEAAPGGGFVGDGGNGDGNPSSKFIPSVEKIFDDYKEPVDYSFRNLYLDKNIGNNTKLTSILNTQKTLDDEKLAAEIELNNQLGGLQTNLTYDTDKKPELNFNYSKSFPFGTITGNANNIYGSNLSYNNNIKGVDVNAITDFNNLNNISLSKSLGDPNKTGLSYDIGTTIDPLDISNSNIFAEAKFKFGKGKKDGGRIGFKNGGLASIL